MTTTIAMTKIMAMAMAMAMTSDILITLGLILISLLIVSYIHHYRDCVHKNDIGRTGEEKAAATVFVGADDADHSQDDYDIDFDYYDENDDGDADDEEIVEITFDLGYLEENINRFRSRIHRIII